MREANERWAAYVGRLEGGGRGASLAKKLGVPQSTVSRWLDGATPTPENLRLVADRLEIPLGELFREAGFIAEGLEQPGNEGSHRNDTLHTNGSRDGISESDPVVQAIRNAPLIPEARQHLLNQYALLLRLPSAAEPSEDPELDAARAYTHDVRAEAERMIPPKRGEQRRARGDAKRA